jgi:pimeloyl-ACP methyl ester carboxylesterase
MQSVNDGPRAVAVLLVCVLRCIAGDLGTVVFLHGFPEIWYTWRHQMLAVAAAGYRAIAPDCRGYGLSDLPPENEEVSFDDLVADVLGILDALNVPKVSNSSPPNGKYLQAVTH